MLAKRLNLFASCFNVGAVANRPRRLRVRTASNSDLDRSLWSTILDEISQQREQVCRCQLLPVPALLPLLPTRRASTTGVRAAPRLLRGRGVLNRVGRREPWPGNNAHFACRVVPRCGRRALRSRSTVRGSGIQAPSPPRSRAAQLPRASPRARALLLEQPTSPFHGTRTSPAAPCRPRRAAQRGRRDER